MCLKAMQTFGVCIAAKFVLALWYVYCIQILHESHRQTVRYHNIHASLVECSLDFLANKNTTRLSTITICRIHTLYSRCKAINTGSDQ